MGFLERAIRRGISQGVSNAVGQAVNKAVEPHANRLANEATAYATEASKNMKICPKCEKVCQADKKFCPDCGTQLPEKTLAEGAVCTNCGTQNKLGEKFCASCGTKLPQAIQEEQMAANRAAAFEEEWNAILPQYPMWRLGGSNLHIEQYEVGCYSFSANFKGGSFAAQNAVEQYRQLLLQNGFYMAGQYPNMSHLYKQINGVCYHVDTEHCFEGDSDCPTIGFDNREPYGGLDYTAPSSSGSSWKNFFR